MLCKSCHKAGSNKLMFLSFRGRFDLIEASGLGHRQISHISCAGYAASDMLGIDAYFLFLVAFWAYMFHFVFLRSQLIHAYCKTLCFEISKKDS